MKVLFFTHPHVVSNLHFFHSLVEYKKIFHTMEVNDYHNFVASNIEQTAPLVANQSLICHT